VASSILDSSAQSVTVCVPWILQAGTTIVCMFRGAHLPLRIRNVGQGVTEIEIPFAPQGGCELPQGGCEVPAAWALSGGLVSDINAVNADKASALRQLSSNSGTVRPLAPTKSQPREVAQLKSSASERGGVVIIMGMTSGSCWSGAAGREASAGRSVRQQRLEHQRLGLQLRRAGWQNKVLMKAWIIDSAAEAGKVGVTV
jgi:hypothetical protein